MTSQMSMEVLWVDQNGVDKEVPFLLAGMEAIDMVPPCSQTVVAVPYKNILSEREARSLSSKSLALNLLLASFQYLFHETMMSLETSTTLSLSLSIDKYEAQSPF